MQQDNFHKAKIITKAGKGGNSSLWAILIGICAFFFIRWIAPLLIAGCFVFGMR